MSSIRDLAVDHLNSLKAVWLIDGNTVTFQIVQCFNWTIFTYHDQCTNGVIRIWLMVRNQCCYIADAVTQMSPICRGADDGNKLTRHAENFVDFLY